MSKSEAYAIAALLLVGATAVLAGTVMLYGIPQALIFGGVLTVWVGTVCIKEAGE